MQEDLQQQQKRDVWERAQQEMPAQLAEARQQELERLHRKQLETTEQLDLERLGNIGQESSHKDSDYYTEVKDSMRNMYVLQTRAVRVDSLASDVQEMRAAYAKLQTACETYLAERPGFRWTPTGRRRQSLVRRMRETAMRENSLLPDTIPEARMRVEAGESIAWTDIVANMRRESLLVNDGEYELGGGGTSEVVRINKGGRRLFFKSQEMLTPTESAIRENNEQARLQAGGGERLARTEVFIRHCERFLDDSGMELDQYLLEVKLHPEREAEFFTKRIDRHLEKNIDDIKKEKEIHLRRLREDLARGRSGATQEMIDRVANLDGTLWVRQLREAYGHDEQARQDFLKLVIANRRADSARATASLGGLTEGTDVAQRNASTTLMGDLLGQPGLVVRSTRANIQIAGETKARQGILMEAAKGKEIDRFTDEEIMKTELTPEAVRQLNMLQVFDYLCGQIDRNLSNYLVQTQVANGRVLITGITGIDNDMSFGTITEAHGMTMQPLTKYRDSGEVNRGLPTEFCLEHLDKDFAESLLALTPEVLIQQFADQLTTEELRALVKRAGDIHRELEHHKNDPGFLVEADAWTYEHVTVGTTSTDVHDGRYAASLAAQIREKQQAIRKRRAEE